MKTLLTILVFLASVSAFADGNEGISGCSAMVRQTVKLYHTQVQHEKVSSVVATLGAASIIENGTAGLVTVANRTQIIGKYWVNAIFVENTCLVQSIEKQN